MAIFSQGPFAPTSASQIADGDDAWSNVGNIAVDDGSSFASVAPVGNPDSTNGLVGSGFGFNIPVSTIVGVVFTQKAKLISAGGSANDSTVQLYNSGVIGSNKGGFNTVNSAVLNQYIYGSSGDDWSAGLTPSIVNGAGFGIYVQWVFNLNLFVDAYALTVYYDVPTTFCFVSSGVDN